MLYIQYAKCSTCKKLLTILQQKYDNIIIRDIKTQNPTLEEIKLFHEKSGLDIKKLFNTSGLKYKELNLKEKLNTLSLEEKYELLASDGMLVKRPILVKDDIVIFGGKHKIYE